MYARKAQRSRGFTLIEVLVVVAIIALLISILLPSLQQARNISKMMVCQAHLKEVGTATQMYLNDSKDMMPGPLHPVFLKNPNQMTYSGLTEAENKFVMNGYLNTRLRKYFGEKAFGKGNTTNQIGTCPSFPIKDETFEAENNVIYNYALNNSELTAPQFYTGMTHGGITSDAAWRAAYGTSAENLRKNSPKNLNRILSGRISAGKEWLVADAFRRPLPQGNPWPASPEPGVDTFPAPDPARQCAEYGSLSPSLQRQSSAQATGKIAPFHPFHMNGGFKKVSKDGGTNTVFYGKTNTLYFDMHAEAQNGWAGSIVPWRIEANRSR